MLVEYVLARYATNSMQSAKEFSVVTIGAAETESLGEKLGALLRGGECIELVSDMGGGKTTFVRGLARGIGSFDAVSSPTFTIARHYVGTKTKLYHYDFYRLENPGLVAEELSEGLHDPQGVSVVEWADSVQSVLPDERIKVVFSKRADDPEARLIKVTLPLSYEYMHGVQL